MSLRIATFNIENLMSRFDFSGYRNQLRRDRVLQMVDVKDETQFRQLEQARVVAHSDDKMQLAALAIAETRADIVCLQEVENIEALKAFEYGYLFKMIGSGYRNKYLIEGNDGRGIDVAAMTRDETGDGDPIELIGLQGHAHRTYEEMGLYGPELKEAGELPHERIFRRDCLDLDFRIGGKRLSIFVTHLKSMGPGKEGREGRDVTMPIRRAESRAVRKIIEQKFGADRTAAMRWLVCGDMNDYREKIVVDGDRHTEHRFMPVEEKQAGYDPLLEGGFSVDLMSRLPQMERWTLFHSRGPEEQHLCQLDHVFASPSLAERNPGAVPEVIRGGQPWRTPFPPGQDVPRYPRIGWDRPKASDHCPVVVTLNVA